MATTHHRARKGEGRGDLINNMKQDKQLKELKKILDELRKITSLLNSVVRHTYAGGKVVQVSVTEQPLHKY